MKRRDLLVASAAAALAASLPRLSSAATAPARPRSDGSVYLDACGGFPWERDANGGFVLERRLLEAISQRRLDVVSMSLGEVGNGPNRFLAATRDIAECDALIEQHPRVFAKITEVADIDRAREAGQLGIIYNFQDTTALETDASNVKTFAALGLHILQLTYNKRNLAGDGCLERSNAGLSDFGRELISKINESRIVLDLSHAGQRTIAEGIEASRAPPIISHSGCRALMDFPRNTHDAELRALADKGGVFGIYLMPFLRPKGQPVAADLLRHLDHAVKVCGEDHVGIGSDTSMLHWKLDAQARKQQREFYEKRAKAGIAAPGEAADVFNLIPDYNTDDRFDRLASDLRKAGWSASRVDKVLGKNFVRVFGEVWGARGDKRRG